MSFRIRRGGGADAYDDRKMAVMIAGVRGVWVRGEWAGDNGSASVWDLVGVRVLAGGDVREGGGRWVVVLARFLRLAKMGELRVGVVR